MLARADVENYPSGTQVLKTRVPSTIPKTTSPKNRPLKVTNPKNNKTKQQYHQTQQNQAIIPERNNKPKPFGAEIKKPNLKEPLRCRDRDFWVWVLRNELGCLRKEKKKKGRT